MHTNTMPILVAAAVCMALLTGYVIEDQQPHDLSFEASLRIARPFDQAAPCVLDAIGEGQLFGAEPHYWIVVKDDYGFVSARYDIRRDGGATVVEYRSNEPIAGGLDRMRRCSVHSDPDAVRIHADPV